MAPPRPLAGLALLVLFGASAIAQQIPSGGAGSAASDQPCGWSSLCPQASPCCSSDGFCSAGVYCLAGANPAGSYQPGYLAPQPICQSNNYTFADDSRIAKNLTAYNGDATQYDWTLDVQDKSNSPLVENGTLALVLTQTGGGTKLSSTRAILYGSISASIQTVGAAGVVTAFITMSGVKDEIDFEWTGGDEDETQTNYYWEGDVNNYKNGGTSPSSNRDTTYHVYGLNWTPSQLQWTIDGKTVRTLTKSSTLDQTSGLYKYPQTPSRIQMSVWPAGIAGASQGTVDWSGGMINWGAPEYTSQGHFAAKVQWVNVNCYSGNDFTLAGFSNSTNSSSSSRFVKRDLWERQSSFNSYVWGSNDTSGQVQVTGSSLPTIINSPYSTGMNMLVKNGDTKGVTPAKGSSSLANTAVGNWWSKLGTPAKVGICIGAVAVALFTLVALCTCIARRKDKKRAAYATVKDDSAAIPLTAAGAHKSQQARVAPQASSASLASSKARYDPYASPQHELTQQQAWTMGQQSEQYAYPQYEQQYAPQYTPQQQYQPQQHYAPQQPYQQSRGGYGCYPQQQQQNWQGGQGRY